MQFLSLLISVSASRFEEALIFLSHLQGQGSHTKGHNWTEGLAKIEEWC